MLCVCVQKSQAMADQAWEKMRATGSVQQGLESECSTLRQQMTEAQHRANTLLTACALLCGAVYPMYARSNALSTQRHILEEQMTVWDNCRERAHYLVNVLNSELAQVRIKRLMSLRDMDGTKQMMVMVLFFCSPEWYTVFIVIIFSSCLLLHLN